MTDDEQRMDVRPRRRLSARAMTRPDTPGWWAYVFEDDEQLVYEAGPFDSWKEAAAFAAARMRLFERVVHESLVEESVPPPKADEGAA